MAETIPAGSDHVVWQGSAPIRKASRASWRRNCGLSWS